MNKKKQNTPILKEINLTNTINDKSVLANYTKMDANKSNYKSIEIDKNSFSIINNTVYIKPKFTIEYFLSLYNIKSVAHLYKWIEDNVKNNIIYVMRVFDNFILINMDELYVTNNAMIQFFNQIALYLINTSYDIFTSKFIKYINITKRKISLINDDNDINETKNKKNNNIVCEFIDKYTNIYEDNEYEEERRVFFIKEVNNNIINTIDYKSLVDEYFININKYKNNDKYKQDDYRVSNFITKNLVNHINLYIAKIIENK